ncbi:MAG: hypothetical protein ACFN1H_01925, partial [Propionibacterium freudenreichii]
MRGARAGIVGVGRLPVGRSRFVGWLQVPRRLRPTRGRVAIQKVLAIPKGAVFWGSLFPRGPLAFR